ncbi:choice-of-anchor J domain-containing protein [Flavobacterium sp. RHBU_3]|uniref:DUF7619 domain-containing protein n=1 Tax=Flavobacterium sp. RHBU_3 TaxID=3391184 RepID=UPI003985343C
MKKTLLTLLSLISFSAFAQIPVEGFEGTWLPQGWSTLNVAGPTQQWQQSNNPYQGNKSAIINGENMAAGTQSEDWLITPQFTVPVGGQVSFASRMIQVGDQGNTYKVMVGTTPNDIASFVPLQQWAELELNPVQGDFNLVTVDIPTAYTGQTLYVAFVMMGDGGEGWIIDNVTVLSVCTEPAQLYISNITATTAQLGWTGPASGSWEVEVVLAGQTPTGLGMPTTANPYIITGLTPGMCYDFYVRSICDIGAVSTWTGPLTFCTIPEEGYSYLAGNAHIDANGDEVCNANDPLAPNMEIQVAINGTAAGSVYTDANGYYVLYVPLQDTYTITLTPIALPGFTAPDPVTATYNFTAPGIEYGPDFCFGLSGESVDNLALMFNASTTIVPGFNFYVSVSAANTGNTIPAAATAAFTYDATRFTLLSYDGAAATASGSVNVDFGNVPLFGHESHVLQFHAEIPPVNNSGDVVTFTAVLNNSDDNIADNTAILNKTIVNSFDPNDITVHEGAEITPEQADGYLTYTVRFQNTGTFAATYVRVEQQLDANLDWDTFMPLTTSHTAQLSRTDGMLVYKFDNINLPYSAADEPGSHGYITYRIKPKSTVAVGDYMYGTASIYFDFNEPIITNTCSTQVVEATSGTDGFALNNIKLYPNPVKDVLNVSITDGTLQSVMVYDLNGRLCLQSANTTTVKTDGLAPGLYLVKVVTDKGSGNYKLIKK